MLKVIQISVEVDGYDEVENILVNIDPSVLELTNDTQFESFNIEDGTFDENCLSNLKYLWSGMFMELKKLELVPLTDDLKKFFIERIKNKKSDLDSEIDWLDTHRCNLTEIESILISGKEIC